MSPVTEWATNFRSGLIVENRFLSFREELFSLLDLGDFLLRSRGEPLLYSLVLSINASALRSDSKYLQNA